MAAPRYVLSAHSASCSRVNELCLLPAFLYIYFICLRFHCSAGPIAVHRSQSRAHELDMHARDRRAIAHGLPARPAAKICVVLQCSVLLPWPAVSGTLLSACGSPPRSSMGGLIRAASRRHQAPFPSRAVMANASQLRLWEGGFFCVGISKLTHQ
jgi:hypothetical protein